MTIDELVEKYHWKKLPNELSETQRAMYRANLSKEFDVNGSDKVLCTKNGTELCKGYNRIVIGDYGAYIEFSKDNLLTHLIIAPGEEYRVFDNRFSTRVKYIWMTVDDGSNVKIYLQQKPVDYADYKPGMYYISPEECLIDKIFDCKKL